MCDQQLPEKETINTHYVYTEGLLSCYNVSDDNKMTVASLV